MKAITAAINEYGLELLNSIEALQHYLLGVKPYQSTNNASATDNKTDVPPLHTLDSDKEEKDPNMPPVNMADSDK